MQSASHKAGKLFILLGIISLAVFFAVDQAKHPSYGYFCVGIVIVILGGVLMARGHQPPAESMRFRTVRRWREQQKQRKAERKKQPFEH